MVVWFARAVFWIIAAFYAYGALVHVLNMLGMSGFSWLNAPAKWQALDLVYLVLDVTVVIGLLAGLRIGYLALIVAAVSQIILYTVLRDWVLDVPEEFARSPEEASYLDVLVIFHIVTLTLFFLAIWLKMNFSDASSERK